MAATTTRKTITATANIDAAKVASDKAYREDLIDGAQAHLGYAYNTVRKFTNDDIIGAYAAEGFDEAGMLNALSGRMGYPMSSITPLCLPALVQLWMDTIQADPKALAEAKAEEEAEKAEEAPAATPEAKAPAGRVSREFSKQRMAFITDLIKAAQYTSEDIKAQVMKAFPESDPAVVASLLRRARTPKTFCGAVATVENGIWKL